MTTKWQDADSSDALDLISEFRLDFTAKRRPPEKQASLWWSVLVHLNSTDVSEFDQKLSGNFKGEYLIPEDQIAGDEHWPDGEHILTIYARAQVIKKLNLMDNDYGVTSLSLGSIVSETSLSLQSCAEEEEGELTVVQDGSVTMAVIDDGIAFAHNLFRTGLCESRVQGMFIMDAATPPKSDVGRKLTKREIDRLLAANTYCGLLDEDSFYRQAGSIDRARFYFSTTGLRRTHGTHVMGLAAGYDMDSNQQQRPILAAQLPTAVTADTSGANLAPSLRKAIHYIRRQSKKIVLEGSGGKPAPLVVNFSYGNFAGPHDGTDLISRVLDRELKSTPEQEIRVILPAGNANLARTHASVAFEDGTGSGKAQIDLNVYPDDHTASYVQLWMPYSDRKTPPNFVNVQVTPPFGEPSKMVRAESDSRQVLCNKEGLVVAVLAYRFEKGPTRRGVITLMVHPTASQDFCGDLAPSGRWKLEIEKCDIEPDQSVEVWVRRDETLPGYPPFGRQAYFDNPGYVRFDKYGAPLATDPENSNCPVKRAGTLSGFATGEVPLVIAGLTEQDGLLSDYSAAGPITATRGNIIADRVGPDAAARSDDSPVLSGVLSAGSSSGSMVRMNGTSVSAPLVARHIADALAQGRQANRDWIWAEAAISDRTYPQPKPQSTRTGGGRLRLKYPFDTKRAEI